MAKIHIIKSYDSLIDGTRTLAAYGSRTDADEIVGTDDWVETVNMSKEQLRAFLKENKQEILELFD